MKMILIQIYMLSIKNCVVQLAGGVVANIETRLNNGLEERLQEVLSKHMQRLSSVEGQIRINEFSFDLGLISNINFETRFYNRLEVACENFVDELLAVHNRNSFTEDLSNHITTEKLEAQKKQVDNDVEIGRLQTIVDSLENVAQKYWVETALMYYKEKFTVTMPNASQQFLFNFIQQTNKEDAAQELFNHKEAASQKSVDNKAVRFLIDLLQKTSLSTDWFNQLLMEYEDKFGEMLAPQIQNLLKKYKDVDDADKTDLENRNELKDLLQSGLNQELDFSFNGQDKDEQNVIQDHIRGREALSFLIELLQKITLSTDWFNQLLMEYEDRFGKMLAPEIQNTLMEFREEYKQLTSLSVGDFSSRGPISIKKQNLLNHLKLLESESENIDDQQELVELMTLIEDIPNELAVNWLSSLLELYQERYEQTLPASMQEMLMNFMETQHPNRAAHLFKEVKTISVHELQESLIEELQQKVEKIESRKEQLLVENNSPKQEEGAVQFILDLLNWINFSGNWLIQIQNEYRDSFGQELSSEIQDTLMEFREAQKQLTSPPVGDFSFTGSNRIRKQNLHNHLKLLESESENTDDQQELVELMTLMEAFPNELDVNWFSSLLELYQERYAKTLPVSMQQLLLNFVETQNQNRAAHPFEAEQTISVQEQKESLIVELKQYVEKIKTSKEQLIMKNNKQKQVDEAVYFILELLNRINLSGDWLNQIRTEYQDSFGQELSSEIQNTLMEFREEQKRIRVSSVQSNYFSKQDLISYLIKVERVPENRDDQKVIAELILLTGKLSQEQNSNWFETLLKLHEEKYSQKMLISLQKILLDYLQEQESRIITKVTSTGPMDTLKETLRKQLETTVLVKANKNSEFATSKSIESSSNNFTLQNTSETEESNSLLSTNSVQNKKLKGVSDQARLLQLKLALGNRLKNKSASQEEVIISGAGIIAGWVLWKKQFEKFGWLKAGLFLKENNRNTAIYAANWLARLGGEIPDSLNLLVSVICGLEEEDQLLLSDEELQQKMGTIKLSTSIDHFNKELLNLWPVFDINKLREFQELFLQREGVLSKTAIGYQLTLVKAPYDLLIERQPIPWPISLISFSWTSTKIEATW
ncbi:MAG: hypothetical protein JKY48_03170 [Flavobacteriales bacterium]|nr:hypothetical protein [Flavobacteriales bacterium]